MSNYKLRRQQRDRGTCRLCGRKGGLLRGLLVGDAIVRATGPFNIYVSLGPYCREHGGDMRLELELAQLMEDPNAIKYAVNR